MTVHLLDTGDDDSFEAVASYVANKLGDEKVHYKLICLQYTRDIALFAPCGLSLKGCMDRAHQNCAGRCQRTCKVAEGVK